MCDEVARETYRDQLAMLAPLFAPDVAVPTLAQALSAVPGLDPSIVERAHAKARTAQRMHPQLSLDECAALAVYTFEAEQADASPYRRLNDALRHPDRRTALEPWRGYMWPLLHAMAKLPPCRAVRSR